MAYAYMHNDGRKLRKSRLDRHANCRFVDLPKCFGLLCYRLGGASGIGTVPYPMYSRCKG